MDINIIAFGQIADIAGKASWTISDVKNTAELNDILMASMPGLAAVKYAIAVNKKMIAHNTILQDDDTVALLPPFSGG